MYQILGLVSEIFKCRGKIRYELCIRSQCLTIKAAYVTHNMNAFTGKQNVKMFKPKALCFVDR